MDYNVRVILGFRVPYKNLFREIAKAYFLCDCDIDRKKYKFCPNCGRSTFAEHEIIQEQILNRSGYTDINFDNLKDNGGNIKTNDIENLCMCQVISNCVLKGKEKDFYIGRKCFNFNPNCPKESVMEYNLEQKDNIIKAIKNTKLYIPYDETSFKLYCLVSIW